ncbi:MAG: rRNA pseudouridine synthase [Ruminococcaceae bacterium]|nr:rRNA pseudouridine synthase [Oscillospiraceae bacterium]
MDSIKLQKYFTDCGVMSRRAAEAEIAAGKVKVNGEVATAGQRIIPGVDSVTYLGKPIEMPKFKKNIYVVLNKPRGYLTTMSDDRGRATVAELVSDVGARVYPVGRLDMDSEGLLLLTNDGELALKLTHPRHEIPKIYHVKVAGKVAYDTLKKLNAPMEIDGYKLLPVKTELISVKSDHSVLKMTLFEGRNRQIRKMCESVELEVLRLKRIAIGNITLGELAPGKWRYLSSAQVEYLRTSGRKKQSNNKTKG